MLARDQRSSQFRRHFCFLLLAVTPPFLFWSSLRSLFSVAFTHDYDSHIFLIVPISAYLIVRKRHEIFSHVCWDFFPGVSLLFAGVFLVLLASWNARLNIAGEDLWMRVLALVVFWIAGFVLCYGIPAFQAARFPLLFLLLSIPIPDFLVGRAIAWLQEGSGFVAFWLFKTLHVPVMREGLVFHVPSLDLEVAKQCSGIRSSAILLITALLVAEFTLGSLLRKSLLVLSVIPIVILKNGLRIVTISLLTVYVSRSFLHGWLHQSGGIVFYVLGLLALIPILKLLKEGQIRGAGGSSKVPVPSAGRTSEGRSPV
ncbi:MAG: exosortase/archaeosortase family protein [Acidobacteriota bacterium]